MMSYVYCSCITMKCEVSLVSILMMQLIRRKKRHPLPSQSKVRWGVLMCRRRWWDEDKSPQFSSRQPSGCCSLMALSSGVPSGVPRGPCPKEAHQRPGRAILQQQNVLVHRSSKMTFNFIYSFSIFIFFIFFINYLLIYLIPYLW